MWGGASGGGVGGGGGRSGGGGGEQSGQRKEEDGEEDTGTESHGELVGGRGRLKRCRGLEASRARPVSRSRMPVSWQLVRVWSCAMTGRELQFLDYSTNKMICKNKYTNIFLI